MASLCLPDVSCFLGRRDFTFPVDRAAARLAGVGDAGVAGAGVGDAGVATVDRAVARLAGVGDAGVGDAGVADAGVADSGVEDISATWLELPVICCYLSRIERII